MGDDFDNPLPIPSGLDWADETPSTDEGYDVRLRLLGPQKISVIRIVRAYTDLGLAETKHLVESAPIVAARGLSRAVASQMVHELTDAGALASIDGEEPPAATGLATVILSDAGERKIAVIKVVREITGLGLRESKQIADQPGSVVIDGVSRERAEHIATKIAEVGGTAEVRDSDVSVAVHSGHETYASVVLTHTGPNKIEVIKVLRETSGLGLKECKDMTESTPSTIGSRFTPERAEQVAQRIRAVGGDAQIELLT